MLSPATLITHPLFEEDHRRLRLLQRLGRPLQPPRIPLEPLLGAFDQRRLLGGSCLGSRNSFLTGCKIRLRLDKLVVSYADLLSQGVQPDCRV